MRRISILLSLLLLTLPLMAQVQTFEWQGKQRQYLIKSPAGQTGSVPVLYFLHGLGDNITRLDNEFHFQQIADRFGWIVVVPQALNEGYGTMWNAGLMNSGTDDAGFLLALLDTLAARGSVNLDSVFFTGFSMGGFMTHRMAIEHGDRITACAPVSGLITHSLSNRQAVTPVKMLHIHGTADPVVGYDGNSQYFGGNLGLSVEAILNYWEAADHCTGEPVIDTFPDLRNDGLRFIRYTYQGDAPLQHIKVIGGNHTWYHSEEQYDIGYMTEIYKFFTSNNGGNAGITQPTQSTLRLWPNPTTGRITVELPEKGNLEVIDMHGHIVATYQLQPGTHHLNLTHLPKGLYHIKNKASGATLKVLVTY